VNVITIFRKLIGANGSVLLAPVSVVSTDELAQKVIDEQRAWLASLQNLHVCEVVNGEPRGVMPVPQLLNMLGIANVGTIRMTSDVKETDLVVATKPQIILQ
jgi:hypothetical protein